MSSRKSKSPAQLVAAVLATPFKLLKSLLFNPLATGSLLYILTRGPEDIRGSLLRGVRVDAIASTFNLSSDAVVGTSTKALKWLVVLGVVSKLNNLLTRLALNNWSWRPQNEPWEWQSGKEIICITGGSSGFGALMVESFVEKTKAKIVVIDIQHLPKNLEALPNVHFYKCDLTQPSQITETVNAIKQDIGDPTVLINNAGIGKASLIIDSTPEWIEKIFRVNILSHWQTVAAFLPAMLKMKKGHVVTVASMATFVAVSNITDYSATKAGLLAFHEGLNQELRHRYTNGKCIQTTIVHPNFAKTPLVTAGMASSGAGKGQEGQLLPPEMISDRIVAQVLSGRSAQIFVPDGMSRASAVRGWPTWIQEMLRDSASKMTA